MAFKRKAVAEAMREPEREPPRCQDCAHYREYKNGKFYKPGERYYVTFTKAPD